MLARGVFAASAALLAAAALVACFDLLHSTADVLTACEIDAARPACGPLSRPQGVDTDFCAWTPDEARQRALHACAWLGACETPMGNNAFGPCLFHALMAYDCSANPNHQPRNDAHRLWDCLQRTQTCSDVDTCVFRDAGPPTCGGASEATACGSVAALADIRVRCAADAADGEGGYPTVAGENCALWGKTCVSTSSGSACAGGASEGCAVSECSPDRTRLQWCVGGVDGGSVDVGIDCASNGAAACAGFPSSAHPQWLACQAEGDGGAGCEPDATATCEDGRAFSCPSGVVESLNCGALLGSANACASGPLTPAFDWTSPCVAGTVECAYDSCDGSTLTSCERGASFQVRCDSQGLGPCMLSSSGPGSPLRAACTTSRR